MPSRFLFSLQEGIALSLITNRGQRSVSGNDDSFVGQSQNTVVKGVQDFLVGSSRKIGASDAPGKQSIARDQFVFSREVEADAALRVPGCVQDLGCERTSFHGVGVAKVLIDLDLTGRGHSNPGRLQVEHLQERIVVLIQKNRRTRGGAQLHRSTNVIDVRVGDYDLLDLQIVLPDQCDNLLDVVPRIDDDGFASRFIADHGAIASQRADRQNLVDHKDILVDHIRLPSRSPKKKALRKGGP
jgi:hypothetical protein